MLLPPVLSKEVNKMTGMKMTRKSPEEHNATLNRRKERPENMTPTEWNTHLDELKRLGKYNGEIYARTRTRIDELFEIEEELKDLEREL